jgi:hypothetical protein
MNPKICLDPNGEEILAGLTLNNNSIVIENVTETYAKTNLVWVISVNETVTSEGDLPRPSAQNTLSNGIKTRAIDRLLRMHKINVKDKKEAWGHGKGEISYSVMGTINPCVKDGAVTNEGFEKIGNNQLNTDCFAGNFSGNSQFADFSAPPQTLWHDNETLKILFYERDLRKKFLKSQQLFTNCINTIVEFGSKESIYGVLTPIHNDYQAQSSTTTTHTFSDITITLKGELK